MSEIIESNETAVSPEQKYFLEAEKRKRADGTKQFQELAFSSDARIRSLADDIFADHDALDKLPIPVKEGSHVKFLILGAGMGGIVQAARFVLKGFAPEQILLVEQAGGVGGTWYWNRYPNLHCDVESYCYLPLLEETGYVPTQKYTSGVEIRKYLEDVLKKFGLHDRVLFRSTAPNMKWDEELRTWRVDLETHHGPGGKQKKAFSIEADIVTIANGLFPFPHVPKVEGLSDFEGPLLHTARWDYNITGGSSDTPFPELDKLKGKRVGFLGTGATCVQALPQIAKYAKEVIVFQRTPSMVHTRGQRDTDPTEWREKIANKPGWHKDRMNNFARSIANDLKPEEENLVDDEWTRLNAYLGIVGSPIFGVITPDKVPEHIGTLLALDSEQNQKARERITEIVKDNETARKLTPWYPCWCKRPTFSDAYLQSYNEENVHLVDTDGRGIDKFTPKGIVANGTEYAVDILILGTGYRSPTYMGDPGTKTGISITGRNSRALLDKWNSNDLNVLHGIFTNGFPNLFFQSMLGAAATGSYANVINFFAEHIAGVVALAESQASSKEAKVLIEPTLEAEKAWGEKIASGSAFFAGASVCTPGYMNSEGEAFKMPPPDDIEALLKKARSAIWYKGIADLSTELEEWRNNGKLEGVAIKVEA